MNTVLKILFFIFTWLITFLPVLQAQTCTLVDDYPNTIASAHSLSANGGIINASINYHEDRDVFRLPLAPFTTYTITMQMNSLSAGECWIFDTDGRTVLFQTNSLAANNSMLQFAYNTSAGKNIYIEAKGLAQLRQGSYALTIERDTEDVDGDGLPDDWETEHSLDPNDATGSQGAEGDPDGDGFTNAEELTLGTHPNDASSGLWILDVQVVGNDVLVTWPVATSRTYALYKAVNVTGEYSLVDQYLHQSSAPVYTYTDVGGVHSQQMYYVEQVPATE